MDNNDDKMKKNKKALSILLAVLLGGSLACEEPTATKPDPELTELQKLDKVAPVTDTGAHTFGCLVSGKVFFPQIYQYPFPGELIAEYLYDDSSLHIAATNDLRKNESVVLHLDKTRLGKHKLVFTSVSGTNYGKYILGDIYETTASDTGVIEITRFDLQKQIVAGKFWFNASERINGLKKESLTEGRFDLKFIVD